MPLTVAQRVVLQKHTQTFAAKLLAAQFVGAYREVVAKDPSTVLETKTKTKDTPLGKEPFFKDATKFVKHNDAAKLINDLDDGRKSLDHTFEFLASYFKQLKPLVDRFTKRMIRYDPAGMNRTQLQQLMGVVGAVLRLAEVLDAAGATASDIVEFVHTLDTQLQTKPSDDRRKSGLMDLFRR